jgi:hypothetical protein
MTTPLEKTLKRQISIRGQVYIVAISPEGLKLTHKGRRKGLELAWEALVSGDAALAVALNASVGKLTIERAEPLSQPVSGKPVSAKPKLGSRKPKPASAKPKR